jgi:hypothetical protein
MHQEVFVWIIEESGLMELELHVAQFLKKFENGF